MAGNSKVVFTAEPATGETNYMVKKWTVNGEEVTRENLAKLEEQGIEMTHQLSNTITIDSLNANVKVEVTFEEYVGFDLPDATTENGYTISGVSYVPEEPDYDDGKVRQGGDVTFTVGLDGEGGYAAFSKLVVNGYDVLNGKLVEGETFLGCEKITATPNANGSYTITVYGVTGEITPDIAAHQLVIGALTVPEAFKDNEELNSVEKIQTKLEAELTGVHDGVVFYDIALKVWDSAANNWIEVTEENFPEDGVNVILEYPDGTDQKDEFTILHMLTTADEENNVKPGDIEKVAHTNEASGLTFHVDSLSPFAISWTKHVETPPTPPIGGGGGGGEEIPEEPPGPLKTWTRTTGSTRPWPTSTRTA